MKYLVCEMEYKYDFSSGIDEAKPIRIIQMVNTKEEAELLLSQLYNIEGYCEETGETKDFQVRRIKC